MPAGVFMLEMKNLRSGRAEYYCRQVAHKLPVKSKIVRRASEYVSTVANYSKTIHYDIFW
jgi:hypothetical protein